MKDKEFTILAIVVGIVGFFWWLWEKKHNAADTTPSGEPSAFPVDPYSPMMGIDPSAFLPPDLSGLSIDVPNQMANLLSNQYIPLFGFVGMAQGTFYS